jgi:hypothetical protein
VGSNHGPRSKALSFWPAIGLRIWADENAARAAKSQEVQRSQKKMEELDVILMMMMK